MTGDIEATDGVMQGLFNWIESETGLCFPEVHFESIRKSARRRCDELGMGLRDYENLVRSEASERTRFFNEIMIGETYFFRDERHFSILISSVLPQMFGEFSGGRRELRLWSATCATGEEAISLVAAVEHVSETLGAEMAYSVLASDINMDALSRLEKGAFPLCSFRNDGKSWHGLLEACGTNDGQFWRASKESLARISIRHLNIFTGDLPEPESLDVVFFRNTLVYMRNDQKETAISRIVGTIRPGGYLFLASPEIPTVRHPRLEVLEREGGFFFRKRAVTDLGHEARRIHTGKSPDASRLTEPRIRAETSRKRFRGEAGDKPILEALSGRSLKMVDVDALRKGLELASSRARSPLVKQDLPEGESETEVALMVETIIATIQANRFTVADELLGKFELVARENFVSQYLRALSKKHQGEIAEALELWERARLFEPRFWPALFQAGLAYSKSNPARGRVLLRECLAAIESDPGSDRYLALLEGFDAPYFKRMAEKLLERMGVE